MQIAAQLTQTGTEERQTDTGKHNATTALHNRKLQWYYEKLYHTYQAQDCPAAMTLPMLDSQNLALKLGRLFDTQHPP